MGMMKRKAEKQAAGMLNVFDLYSLCDSYHYLQPLSALSRRAKLGNNKRRR